MRTDPLDDLTAANEARIAEELEALFAAYLETIDADALATSLDDTDANHVRDQLRLHLALNEENVPEAIAEGLGGLIAVLASFVGAAAALASSQAKHSLNPNNPAIQSAATAAPEFLRRFLADTGLAISAAIEDAIYSPAQPRDRALQLRRVLGLSIGQARQLEVLRNAMRVYLDSPKVLKPTRISASGERIPAHYVRRVDPRKIIASTRGHISAAQRAMLTKALANPKLTEAEAAKLLDRHANAMRRYRIKAAVGEGMHHLAETAKLIGWQIAQVFGALKPNQRRHWRTAGDERVRHAHNQVPGMSPNGVALNEPFATPFGPRMYPPLEHGCRCRAVLGAIV